MSLPKAATAFIIGAIVVLGFQNCSKNSGGGSTATLTQLSSNEGSITLQSVSPGANLLGCEIQFNLTHPAGNIDVEVYLGEKLYGSHALGDLEASDNQEATMDCQSVELFPLSSGLPFDFSLALKVDGEVVGDRSNAIVYDVPKLLPLGVQAKYQRRGHTIYLYDDYSHCKYAKVDRSTGNPITEVDFQKILEFNSGGVCNGSYNGTGTEPTDWTFPALSSTILAENQSYRIDGRNVRFGAESLCFLASNNPGVPGLIDADALDINDPVKIELLLLLRELYNVNVTCQ